MVMQRRKVGKILGGIVGSVMSICGLASSAEAQSAFNLDTGNAALEIVVPTFAPVMIQKTVGHGDASIILHNTVVLGTAWFDAIAPYHPTAVGVYSSLGRRPAAESTTNRQRNIALLYASYRALLSTLPQHASTWQNMLRSVGLNPDDAHQDTTTPIGIGNTAGVKVVTAREHDGMNLLGDEGGREYHRAPYADYVGYKPVNTPYDIVDPSRWQPNVRTMGNGLFSAQQFVTPHAGLAQAYSYANVSHFRVPAPKASDFRRNPAGYKRQVDEVISASANLTDYQKLIAEFYDHKFDSLAGSSVFALQDRELGYNETIQYEFLLQVAAFDGMIAAWKEKKRHDAVRPFTAIRKIYGDQQITAWGGPRKGTVSDITGNEWRSYLNTADHPEYPSGSGCFCGAHAEASRRFLGSDELGFSKVIPKGASLQEPGFTPRQDTELKIATWTEFEQQCKMSRFWGGVHFRPATEAGANLCRPIGIRAYNYVKALIAGDTKKAKDVQLAAPTAAEGAAALEPLTN
jgi:hypothetical protein